MFDKKLYQKEYRDAHKVKNSLYQKKYRDKNKLKTNVYNKHYHNIHKVRIKIYRDSPENKIKKNIYNRQYKKKPEVKERIRRMSRKWQVKNPNKILQYSIRQLTKYSSILNMNPNEYMQSLLIWAKVIKSRDYNECQICDSTVNLNSHHLFHKAKYPKLSLNINNGITLCYICHMEAHYTFIKSKV